MSSAKEWQICERVKTIPYIPVTIADRDGVPVAEVRGPKRAAFVLQACKSYDLLLDAVIKCDSYFIATASGDMWRPEHLQKMCDEAGLAIRLAIATINIHDLEQQINEG